MQIAEVFGYGVDDTSPAASSARKKKHCRFRSSPCTKSSKTDPIGVCSLSDGKEAASLCPVRFLENDRILTDAAGLAFGHNIQFGAFPEVRILKVPAGAGDPKERKIGKVDFVLGKIVDGEIVDFAAVEVQAVYFSGPEIRTPMRHFLEHNALDVGNSDRRPDFRSSAQKRLVPQLQLKVPVFRRWGKKFFVVVDSQFFRALPNFPSTSQANSELTWLCYSFQRVADNYSMREPTVVHSEWDAVQNSLREGVPPEPSEIVEELQIKLDGPKKAQPRLFRTT